MFRPMIEDADKWDILFPAKAMSWDNPWDRIMQYEMTHLTCFLGGMYGLGAKLFNREKDLETAKKLTDGCVWAYQMTPSGLMAEAAEILPCPTLEKCEFNRTFWEEKLDPSWEWRTEKVANWDADQAARKLAEQQAASAAENGAVPPGEKDPAELKKAEAELLKEKALEAEAPVEVAKTEEQPVERPAQGIVKRAAVPPQSPDEAESLLPDSLKQKLEPESHDEAEAPIPHAEHAEGDADVNDAKQVNSIPEPNVPQRAWDKVETARPSTHEEYIKYRTEEDGMRPGMVEVMARFYILR